MSAIRLADVNSFLQSREEGIQICIEVMMFSFTS